MDMGLEFPEAPEALGLYTPAVRVGQLVFTSGALPTRDGQLIAKGKVPDAVDLDQAGQCARQAVLNALAAAAEAAGGLDEIIRIVRLNVFVNSGPGFTAQPQVANPASQLLIDLFGDAGRHTRCALGAAELPLDAPLELDLVLQVR